MGRKKGESYRKGKLRDVKRKECPKWTINERVLHELSEVASVMGVCQSRIVEAALNKMLKEPTPIVSKNLQIDKIFTKS